MLPALLVLGASSVLNSMYYIPAMITIWGSPARPGREESAPPAPADAGADYGFMWSTAVLIVCNLALGVCMGPVMELLERGIALL